MQIAIDEPKLHSLITALDATEERGAALYLTAVGDRYLVREVEVAGPEDRLATSATHITFAPQFLARVTRWAREQQMHLAILHTHPGGYRTSRPSMMKPKLDLPTSCTDQPAEALVRHGPVCRFDQGAGSWAAPI